MILIWIQLLLQWNSKGNAGHNKELKPCGSIVSIDLSLIDLRETKISFYGMNFPAINFLLSSSWWLKQYFKINYAHSFCKDFYNL